MARSLRFRIENLGPIRRGEVELRPLTLLIGKNNTGKTYVAQAIHAASRTVRMPVYPTPSPLLSEAEIAYLQAIFLDDDVTEEIALPHGILSKAVAWMEDLLQHASGELVAQMCSYFSVRHLQEVSNWNSNGTASVNIDGHYNRTWGCMFGTSAGSPLVVEDLVRLNERNAFGFNFMLKTIIDRHQSRSTYSPEVDAELVVTLSTDSLARSLWRSYLDGFGYATNSYYLPSGRSGLLLAAPDLIRRVLDRERERFGSTSDLESSLSGVAFEFLAQLQLLTSPDETHLHHRRHGWQELEPAVDLLEQAIEGTVAIRSDSAKMPSLVYEQASNELPIRRTSAMVADLAPLSAWLRGLVRPGDLLIVDEPESHLHPEATRLVARALVRLANVGVRVLCTTHSSVLLHQISNCMLLATAPSVDTDLSEEDGIAHDDIGVFRFHHDRDANGVVISPAKIDPDWGIPEDEYVDIAEDLTHQTARLIRSNQS